MTVVAEDLRQLDQWVREDRWPQVACPVCKVGHLNPDGITAVLSGRSTRMYDETHMAQARFGTFHGVLRCAVHKCRETVVVAGDYAVEVESRKDRDYDEAFDVYRLRIALPALEIILPPTDTPTPVTKAIDSAAVVIWADPSAAANRLRFAIDELLTAYGMARYRNVSGKRRRLTTDRRIREFREYEYGAADALEAVKWI